MSIHYSGFAVRALEILTLVALLAGCAQNAPYHAMPGAAGTCVAASPEPDCTPAYYQEEDGYDLAFAEYSDRGNAFNDGYIEDILQRIRDKADSQGVVLVVFIHGWKHNASEDDENLLDFKKSLGAVRDLLKQDFYGTGLENRQLIGLYVGWRGSTIDLPVIKELTFWDRKAVAEEVGKGGVTRLLLELDEITNCRNKKKADCRFDDVMVVIGHSFGGAIVVSALSDVLTERVVDRTRRRGYARTIGDGVLVLNPAIEANQALSFVEAAIKQTYAPEQYPLFVSLSSDADWPTHYAFPLGQTFGLLLTWEQEDLERSYYYDRVKRDDKIVMREEHLDATTVGNFAPFLTHRLTREGGGDTTRFLIKTCEDFPDECEPRGLTTLCGHPAIRNLSDNNKPAIFFQDR